MAVVLQFCWWWGVLGAVSIHPACSFLYSTSVTWTCGEILRLVTSGLISGSKAKVLFGANPPMDLEFLLCPFPLGVWSRILSLESHGNTYPTLLLLLLSSLRLTTSSSATGSRLWNF